MRVDALLSRCGYCSRRHAEAFVRAGRVCLSNGEVIRSSAAGINPEEVLIDGTAPDFLNGIYIVLYKPVGYTCTHKPTAGEKSVYDLLPRRWRLRTPPVQTAGRLDKDTSGILPISDDGRFVHALTSPRMHVNKTYAYRTTAPVPPQTVELFAGGTLTLRGEDTPCLPATLCPDTPYSGTICLTEGRYHQVRRMLAAVGAPVAELCRIGIGALQLRSLGLTPGRWCTIEPTSVGYERK